MRWRGLFYPRGRWGRCSSSATGLAGTDLLDLCRSRVAREELFQALLRQVSEPGALNVVVVEDVHWADEATVNLMRFVGGA